MNTSRPLLVSNPTFVLNSLRTLPPARISAARDDPEEAVAKHEVNDKANRILCKCYILSVIKTCFMTQFQKSVTKNVVNVSNS